MYSATSGATTATAGQTIASAVWNQINTDYAAALTTLGTANIPSIGGSAKSAVFNTLPAVCSLQLSAQDVGSFAIPVIASVPLFKLNHMKIYNAGATLNSVTVTLYTGAGASGTTVIQSTATTVTSSLANTPNNMQIVIPTSGSNTAFQAGTLFLHISTSTNTSSFATVMLQYEPLY